jgi:hypothetical protein
MVSHKVQERLIARELVRAQDGMAIAQWLALSEEAHMPAQAPRSIRIAVFVAGPNHHTDLFDVGKQRLFDQDAEDGLLLAIRVNQGL